MMEWTGSLKNIWETIQEEKEIAERFGAEFNYSKMIKSVFHEEELFEILPPFLLGCCIRFTHNKIIPRLPVL